MPVSPSATRPAGAPLPTPRRSGLAAAALGLALLAAVPAARAHGVQWSIGVQLPSVGAVVTHAPPVPAYPVYGPPPVVVVPPPRVVYSPPPVYYAPPPPAWGWGPPQHRHHWKDRDRDGIPDRWEHRERRGRGW